MLSVGDYQGEILGRDKYEVEQNIIWLPGKGYVSFWYDNWLGLGPLYIHLPTNAKPKDVKIIEVLTQGSWQLDSMGIEVPESVRDEVFRHQITLSPTSPNRVIWAADTNGKFSITSAWELLRDKKEQSR
nr:uncharacterized protein LOC117279308 [Nicotiana tomentosiformis]